MLVRLRIDDEEQALSWEEWEERVRQGRVPPYALVRFEPVTGARFVPAETLEMYHSLRNEAAIAWQGRFTSGPPPILTALLVGVQIRVWWGTWLPDVRRAVLWRFTNWTAPALEDGESWRMLTMGLLHIETAHLVLNMLWLAYTGWNIERALGRANLAVLYFGSVLGGGVLSLFASPQTPSLGASGGVFGLVAASVVFGFVRPDLLPERGRRLFGMAMLPYLVLMFVNGLSNPTTDNWSHLGGLLTGGLLGLLLDPEPLQRRAGWNRSLRLGTLGIGALTVLVVGVWGPRLYPLIDHTRAGRSARLVEEARAFGQPPPTQPYVSLSWEVPAGWDRGTTLGRDMGFSSPVGHRVWAVTERQAERPVDAEALYAAWLDGVRASYDPIEAGPLEEAVVAGYEGVAARVVVPRSEPVVVEWRAAVRGVWHLQEVWEVEASRTERLAPLRDRLRERVEWSDPEELVDARALLERNATSNRGRARMATALAEVGEPERAMALWTELLAERPEDASTWQGALHTARWYPDAVPEVEALWRRALAIDPPPGVLLEVVEGLEAAGRATEALGILEIAWARSPGDRSLRRAREKRGLPVTLDPQTHLPLSVLVTPDGEARSEEAIAALRSEPPSLEEAAARGGAVVEARQTLADRAVEQLRAGDPEVVATLLRIRFLADPPDPAAAAEGLSEEIRGVGTSHPPGWMPRRLHETLRPLLADLEEEPDDAGSPERRLLRALIERRVVPCPEEAGWCVVDPMP